MNKIYWFLCLNFIGGLTACNNENSTSTNNQTTSANGSDMKEGVDYVTLKRFRVVDNQLFSQPIEASSFLLPANWQVNSSIRWNAENKCMPEMLQANMQAKSPDGAFEIFVLPTTQFDWSDDPIQVDAMQRGFYVKVCNLAQPLDASQYIGSVLAPSIKARVNSTQSIPELQSQMDAGATQMTNAARQAGNYAYNHRGSAAESKLQFDDGKEGLAFCTIMQTIVSVPGSQGGMANNYLSYVSMRVAIKYPTGSEAMARKIMGTLFSSTRMNPQWTNAVQQYFAAVSQNAQGQLNQQIAIARAAQEEISNNIIRNWESQKSTKSSGINSVDNTEQFGQYLRGVDSWTDENGSKVELTSGYSNAWSKSDGTYIMSNNPAFDPNVTFQEDWKRMKQ
jgi:hypothetical protein